MERGSFLPDEDMEIARPVCVIGAKVYRELFGQQNALGELVNLGGFRCRVIGILGSQGRSLGFATTPRPWNGAIRSEGLPRSISAR